MSWFSYSCVSHIQIALASNQDWDAFHFSQMEYISKVKWNVFFFGMDSSSLNTLREGWENIIPNSDSLGWGFVLFCFVLFLFKLQWNLSQKVHGWLLEDENLSFQKNPYIHRDLKAEGCLPPPSFLHQGKTSLTECQIEKTGSPVKELESRWLPQKSTARTARRTRKTELDPKVPIASWVTYMEAR